MKYIPTYMYLCISFIYISSYKINVSYGDRYKSVNYDHLLYISSTYANGLKATAGWIRTPY